MHPPKNAPSSPQELLERSYRIAGLTLGELAAMANVVIPADLKRHKGWPGMLIEKWLGATAGSKPQQDFPELGVELKTIPIDKNFNPLETTYVCYAPLMSKPGTTWQTSNVRNKLQQVLWVPLEGDRSIPLCERRIATAFFWRPSEQEDQLLQRDWEELTDLIVLGEIEKITARLGQALHMRPKAASGRVLTDAMNTDGQRIRTRPRGFYLRTAFTGAVLHRQFR